MTATSPTPTFTPNANVSTPSATPTRKLGDAISRTKAVVSHGMSVMALGSRLCFTAVRTKFLNT